MNTMEIWPNLFIVGAAKAGTTSIYEYLKNIPGIYMSPRKEPHYFDSQNVPDNHPYSRPIRNKKKYLELFASVTNQKVIGEATPSYLHDSKAPKLIHEQVPDARIIISLRDPIERLFSLYLMLKNQTSFLQRSLHEQLVYEFENQTYKMSSRPGLLRLKYYENVKRYVDVFGKNQVKIIIFEDFIRDIKTSIQDILNFLGLPQTYIDIKTEKINPYGSPRGTLAQKIITSTKLSKISKKFLSSSSTRLLKDKVLLKKEQKPKLSKEDKELLVTYFKEDVKKLEEFLGRKLPWPNF